MADSQTSLQLRQRGVAVAAGGALVQLLGVFILIGTGGWAFLLLLPLVAGASTALSYTRIKDHTGPSTGAAMLTAVVAFLSAAFVGASWFGVLLTVAGAVAVQLGNKQLVAGIRF